MKFIIFFLFAILSSSFIDSVIVLCKYEDHKSYGYKCVVKYLNISSKEDQTITDVIGDHRNGRNNSDVKYFNANEQIVKYFPLNLSSIFNNLETILINNANLSEIHSSDLQQFGENLKHLYLNDNSLEILEADLFQFNPNLKKIYLNRNKLKFIDDGAFRGLKKLIQLYLNGNLCMNKDADKRSNVKALIPEAEKKCKNYAFMLRKLQRDTRAQFDEFNREMKTKFLKCQCGMSA